ncbi:MAG: hypothetical protein IPP91_13780 [Betaproteobacteria bacterium]|nr:hypothetical protein [Betaproteobacteria bacterium]
MNEPAAVPERGGQGDRRLTHILYALHALAPFTAWLLAVLAIILGMARRDDVRGTYLDSHFSWLSRTFWWGLLWIAICAVITAVLFVSLVGWLIIWLPFTILFFWYLYRVLKGWLRLNDGLPVE